MSLLNILFFGWTIGLSFLIIFLLEKNQDTKLPLIIKSTIFLICGGIVFLTLYLGGFVYFFILSVLGIA